MSMSRRLHRLLRRLMRHLPRSLLSLMISPGSMPMVLLFLIIPPSLNSTRESLRPFLHKDLQIALHFNTIMDDHPRYMERKPLLPRCPLDNHLSISIVLYLQTLLAVSLRGTITQHLSLLRHQTWFLLEVLIQILYTVLFR